MCVAVPAEIKIIKNSSALVAYMGMEREVDISLVPDVREGDFVIIHAGFAIQVLDKTEAEKTLKLFKEIEELTD